MKDGQYFADFAGKKCYKRWPKDDSWCFIAMNGFMSFYMSRLYVCV